MLELRAVGVTAHRFPELADLQRTLNDADADVVVSGTPLDLARLVDLDKPVVRAHYGYADAGPTALDAWVVEALAAARRSAPPDQP